MCADLTVFAVLALFSLGTDAVELASGDAAYGTLVPLLTQLRKKYGGVLPTQKQMLKGRLGEKKK